MATDPQVLCINELAWVEVMANLTLAIDEELLQGAKQQAVKEKTQSMP